MRRFGTEEASRHYPASGTRLEVEVVGMWPDGFHQLQNDDVRTSNNFSFLSHARPTRHDQTLQDVMWKVYLNLAYSNQVHGLTCRLSSLLTPNIHYQHQHHTRCHQQTQHTGYWASISENISIQTIQNRIWHRGEVSRCVMYFAWYRYTMKKLNTEHNQNTV